MAVEFRLDDRHPGRREHDHQRGYARDDVVGGAQGDDCGGIVSTRCTAAVNRCAIQIQATAELALGLDSRGRLSLRRRGCRYTTGEGARLSTNILTLSLVST